MSEQYLSSNVSTNGLQSSRPRITIPLLALSPAEDAPSNGLTDDEHRAMDGINPAPTPDDAHDTGLSRNQLFDDINDVVDATMDEEEEALIPTVKLAALRRTTQPHNLISTSAPLSATPILDHVASPADEEQQTPTLKMPALTRPLAPTDEPSQNDLSTDEKTIQAASLPVDDEAVNANSLPVDDEAVNANSLPVDDEAVNANSLPVDDEAVNANSLPTDNREYEPVLQLSELDITCDVGIDEVQISLEGSEADMMGEEQNVMNHAPTDEEFSEVDVDAMAMLLLPITNKLPVMLTASENTPVLDEIADNSFSEATIDEVPSEVDEQKDSPTSPDGMQVDKEQDILTISAKEDAETTLEEVAANVAFAENFEEGENNKQIALAENITAIVEDNDEALPEAVEDETHIDEDTPTDIEETVVLQPEQSEATLLSDQQITPDVSASTALQEQEAAEQPASTPLPTLDTPRPQWEEIQQTLPITPMPPVQEESTPTLQGRGSYYRRLLRAYWRSLISGVLIIVLLLNLLLLWQNVSSPHLLLSGLNPGNGTVITQDDLGSVANNAVLTNPLYGASETLIGVQVDTPGNTQNPSKILTLRGFSSIWHTRSTVTFRSGIDALSMTQNGHFITVSPREMQVLSPTGQQRWQIQGTLPVRSAHPFQPVTDTHNVFTVQSASSGKIAAYNIQSGQVAWTHTLDDTLYYTPPFLLYANTLYIASDHALYALNSTDGSQRWKVPYVARTLLMFNSDTQSLLVAAGPQGLTAFDGAGGQAVWNFSGQMSNRLTPPQLYQATLASASNVQPATIYATGIVWQMPEAQQQVWLYAVNASNGQMLWARRLATGFVSADAGRMFIPLVDSSNGLVIVQEQLSPNEERISAFNSVNGSLRWQNTLSNSLRSAPTLLKTSDGTVLAFTVTNNIALLLRTFSLTRLLFLFCIVLSIGGLVLLWRHAGKQEQQQRLYTSKRISASRHSIQQQMLTRLQRVRQQRPTLASILAISLPLLACISTILYSTLDSPQMVVALVNITTGSQQWTHAVGSLVQPLGTSGSYSVVETSEAGDMRQIEVLNQHGTVLWHSFASEGYFSVPALPTTGSTLLVALRGPDTLPYQYAPADPAYPPALRDMLAFYQFDVSTGRLLWSHIAAYPGLNQSMNILGVDNTYIYVAGIPFSASTATPADVAATLQPQLFAVNRHTGNVDWHIFGPMLTAGINGDAGRLLLSKRLVIWQIDGTVYAIDPLMGQIEWRHPFSQNNLAQAQHEEQQMTLTADVLLVPHNNSVYALDPTSGNLLWSLTEQTTHPLALAVSGSILLIGNGNRLSAYALNDQHQLWQQEQAGIVQAIQADATTAYALSTNGGTAFITATQAQHGIVQWSRAITGGNVLTPLNFLYSNGSLFIGLCQNTHCTNAQLTLFQASSGTARWQKTMQQMNGTQFSQDETSLLFGTLSRPWPGI